ALPISRTAARWADGHSHDLISAPPVANNAPASRMRRAGGMPSVVPCRARRFHVGIAGRRRSICAQMTSYDTLEIAQDGPVRHIRLNRPEVRNAFNGVVIDDLHKAFAEADAHDATRVVVLSGNGKSFSAGADLGWMKDQAGLPHTDNQNSADYMARMFLAIARCKKPVVARIHGHALGGGSGLTAAVDIAICTDDCLFGMTEVKL